MELGVALNRLPGLPLPRCNEAQGWCAVCRDPRLEDSFQARACIDDLKEVSAAIVKCGTGLTTLNLVYQAINAWICLIHTPSRQWAMPQAVSNLSLTQRATTHSQ